MGKAVPAARIIFYKDKTISIYKEKDTNMKNISAFIFICIHVTGMLN
jgi:hypothetical protein